MNMNINVGDVLSVKTSALFNEYILSLGSKYIKINICVPFLVVKVLQYETTMASVVNLRVLTTTGLIGNVCFCFADLEKVIEKQ